MATDSFNWGASILLSLLLFGVVFMQRGYQLGVDTPSVGAPPLVTHLTFKRPVFNQSTESIANTPPVTHKTKSRHKPAPIKKTRSEAVVNKNSYPLMKTEKTEPVKQVASRPQPQGQLTNFSSEKFLQQKRALYLHKLLSHIESFKFYPQAARRRGIEGNVKVSFILRDDGGYDQLVLNGERSVLVNATRMALNAALPLPTPDRDLELTRQIEFSMAYTLD